MKELINSLWETNNAMNIPEVIDNTDFFSSLYEIRNILRSQLMRMERMREFDQMVINSSLQQI